MGQIKCRICESHELVVLKEYGSMPIAGIYYGEHEPSINSKLPLTVLQCNNCKLVQLKEVIPESYYKNYNFVGNSADTYKLHLSYVSEILSSKIDLSEADVFEVGASNGVLLNFLKEKNAKSVAGVEPSSQLCLDAKSTFDIDIMCEFFGYDYIKKNIKKFDVIIIRHVLEHINNLNEIIDSIEQQLNENGMVYIEVPYLNAMIKNNNYSNIFHEHVNYFSFSTLDLLLRNKGLHRTFSNIVDIHGGSISALYKRGKEVDKNYSNETNSFDKFFENDAMFFSKLHDFVIDYSSQGKTLHGYGGSHRTSGLLSRANLDFNTIPVLYDNNKFLQNKKINGLHSLIQAPFDIHTNNPDGIIIFASSYEEEIKNALLKEIGYKGDIITLGEFDAHQSHGN